MKKLWVSLFLLVVWFLAVTFAQSYDLWYVDLNFCNGQNQLHIQSNAGETTGFCMIFTNISSLTWTIKVALVDGEMSVGEHPVKACKTTSEGYFAKFVTLSGIATGNVITLPPNSWVVQQWIISVPNWFVGILNGCITFTVQNGDSQSSWMFQIINRKANIMDVTVSGSYVNGFSLLDMQTFSGDKRTMPSDTKILSSDTPILITQNSEHTTLVVGLQNTGFVDENYSISGTISNNIFGQNLYVQHFDIGSGILYGQDSVVLEHILDSLPFYKGKYSITIDITHSPVAITWVNLFTDTGDISQLIHQNLTVMIYPDAMTLVYILIPVLLLGCIIIIIVVRKNRASKNTAKKRKTIK